MVHFESDFPIDELVSRWDEYTSPSRFAGNDDSMDLIFVAKRDGYKVKLARRTRANREPFSTIFRGHIVKTEKGSKISGFFVKSILDYIAIGLILGFLFYVRATFSARGDSLNTINYLIGFGSIFGVGLLYNTRSSKRKYADFIARITGTENNKYLTKKELEELDNIRED